MNNGIIAILDSDAEYALKLSEYFNLKSGLNYSVSVFTRIEQLILLKHIPVCANTNQPTIF